MKQRKKKKKINKKYMAIGCFPIVIFIITIIVVTSTMMMYFSNSFIGNNLSNAENEQLIQQTKDKSNEISFKDYYGTDKRFKLGYEYILAYAKYVLADNESKDKSNQDSYDFKDYTNLINESYAKLRPQLEYKIDKIITEREYKVKVREFKKIPNSIYVIKDAPGSDEELPVGITYCYTRDVTYEKTKDKVTHEVGRPTELMGALFYEVNEGLKAENFKAGDKLFIINENSLYEITEHEETRVDRKEETAEFLIRAKSISASYVIEYENKSDVKQNEDEKITVTKPIIKAMKQTDKKWDVLKDIVKSAFPYEDTDKAVEVILASALSYVKDIVKDDMIFTGNGGMINPEAFTGGQSEFINKVLEGATKSYKEYGILPSITIAQAILESGWGQSGLTQKANNLFGIKAFGWSGATIDMLTKEYDSNGGEFYVTATFRAYSSWGDSIDDHSKVLLQPNFSGVKAAKDYREAAYALRDGGYATDPAYPDLIISVIDMYSLYQYDK